jgi:hypothetical protein
MFDFGSTLLISSVAIVGLLAVVFFLSKKTQPVWKSKVRLKLSQINSKSSDLRLRLLELDKLLEFTLQNHFYIQEPIGNILKQKANYIDKRDLNKIWTAHKLRNQLAHDIDFTASYNDLQNSTIDLNKYINQFSN